MRTVTVGWCVSSTRSVSRSARCWLLLCCCCVGLLIFKVVKFVRFVTIMSCVGVFIDIFIIFVLYLFMICCVWYEKWFEICGDLWVLK